MFDKKKLNFWRLTMIFISITVIVLFMLWSTPQAKTNGMMDSSMGNMMKSMHVSNIKIYDLLSSKGNQQQMDEMHKHHANQESIIYKLGFFTTALIFLLLPLIIAGSILLAIVWIK